LAPFQKAGGNCRFIEIVDNLVAKTIDIYPWITTTVAIHGVDIRKHDSEKMEQTSAEKQGLRLAQM